MADNDGVTITFDFRLKPEAAGPFLQGAPMLLQATAQAEKQTAIAAIAYRHPSAA